MRVQSITDLDAWLLSTFFAAALDPLPRRDADAGGACTCTCTWTGDVAFLTPTAMAPRRRTSLTWLQKHNTQELISYGYSSFVTATSCNITRTSPAAS
jgi:hypothetical protein